MSFLPYFQLLENVLDFGLSRFRKWWLLVQVLPLRGLEGLCCLTLHTGFLPALLSPKELLFPPILVHSFSLHSALMFLEVILPSFHEPISSHLFTHYPFIFRKNTK